MPIIIGFKRMLIWLERLTGSQEVVGSSPFLSANPNSNIQPIRIIELIKILINSNSKLKLIPSILNYCDKFKVFQLFYLIILIKN